MVVLEKYGAILKVLGVFVLHPRCQRGTTEMAEIALTFTTFVALMILSHSQEASKAIHKVSKRQEAKCGKTFFPMHAIRRADGDGQRIVGGVEARPGSHPWLVSLQQRGIHLCGGALLRVNELEESDIVLTAAHCVCDGLAKWTIVAGGHDLDNRGLGQAVINATAANCHPQYDRNTDTTINDIAVVLLSVPIKFSQFIQPICLPQQGEGLPNGEHGIVAGWGLREETTRAVSRVLMQVGVPIVDIKTCIRNYESTGLLISPKEMLCAGYANGGRDACQGDSGSPLVFPSRRGYILHGIVSFGDGCARPNKPGIYTRVTNYISWIKDQIKALSMLTNTMRNVTQKESVASS